MCKQVCSFYIFDNQVLDFNSRSAFILLDYYLNYVFFVFCDSHFFTDYYCIRFTYFFRSETYYFKSEDISVNFELFCSRSVVS